MINQLEQHYRFIADEGGLFYDNVGNRSRRCSAAMQKRQQAQQYLLKATAAKD